MPWFWFMDRVGRMHVNTEFRAPRLPGLSGKNRRSAGGNLRLRRADYPWMIRISAVIPTCDRRESLRALLKSLAASRYPLTEILIVDAGTPALQPDDVDTAGSVPLRLVRAARSVSVQRNLGIREAASPWIFLVDDDMHVPPDYLQQLATYLQTHPDAGAVSGTVLQPEDGTWRATYPVRSSGELLYRFCFGLGIWGELSLSRPGRLSRRILAYYRRRGNHISRSGWPVLTDFSGACFRTPLYGLGASVVRRQWLTQSPFDEVLDSHGIGDHYGVAAGFPGPVHVLTDAPVYHHQSSLNRPAKSRAYYLRIAALDYFRRQPPLHFVRKTRLLWSLGGNLFLFVYAGEYALVRASLRLIAMILLGSNPYCRIQALTAQTGSDAHG